MEYIMSCETWNGIRIVRLPLATNSAWRLSAAFLVLGERLLGCGRLADGLASGLLLVSLGLLFGFSGVDSSITLSFPDLGLDGLLGLNLGPALSSNTSLRFERTSRSLSGIDFSHGTLLVLSSVEDSPCDLSRVLLFLEQSLGLAVDQDDLFAIKPDKRFAMSRVDLETRKLANFRSHIDDSQRVCNLSVSST